MPDATCGTERKRSQASGVSSATVECLTCGKAIVRGGGRGRPAVYCSPECRQKGKNERRPEGGRYRQLCALPPDQRPQCSTDDCDRAVLARGMCATHYTKWFRADRPHRRSRTPNPLRDRTCLHCGRPFSTRTKGTRYCSISCGQRHLAGWSTSTAIEVYVGPRQETPRRRKVPTTSGRLFVSGVCRRCGDLFTIIDQLANVYCSDRCRNADAKDRRRARKREAYVADVRRRDIYERDKWRCQICRKPVARTKDVPHPKAPVLDHIVPLAQGGMHEPSNVQCAHFICNSLKSDGAANDQLRLFG